MRRPVERADSAAAEPTIAHLELQVALDEVQSGCIDNPFFYLVRVRLEPQGTSGTVG